MDEVRQKALRSLPSVDELLGTGGAAALLESYPRAQVVEAVRAAVKGARQEILGGTPVAEPAGGPAASAPASVPEATGDHLL